MDNVPGVEKWAPKTAVKWLTEHGSLDAIAPQCHQGVAARTCSKALDWLPMGRQAVTIRQDCDVRPHRALADAGHPCHFGQDTLLDLPPFTSKYGQNGFRTAAAWKPN